MLTILWLPHIITRKISIRIVKKRAKNFLLDNKKTNINRTIPDLDTLKNSIIISTLKKYYYDSHKIGNMFELIENKITNKYIVKDIGEASIGFNEKEITLLVLLDNDKKYCYKTFNLKNIVSFKTVVIESLYDGPDNVEMEDLLQLQAYENHSLKTSIRDSVQGKSASYFSDKALLRENAKRNEIIEKINKIESNKKSKTVIKELVLDDGNIYLFNDLNEETVRKLEKMIDEMFV